MIHQIGRGAVPPKESCIKRVSLWFLALRCCEGERWERRDNLSRFFKDTWSWTNLSWIWDLKTRDVSWFSRSKTKKKHDRTAVNGCGRYWPRHRGCTTKIGACKEPRPCRLWLRPGKKHQQKWHALAFLSCSSTMCIYMYPIKQRWTHKRFQGRSLYLTYELYFDVKKYSNMVM